MEFVLAFGMSLAPKTFRRTKAEVLKVVVADPDEWIERHLATWARWMRRGEVTKGYPSRSAGLTGFTHTDTESSYNGLDSAIARAVAACMIALSGPERQAVTNRYGFSRCPFSPEHEAELYASAKAKLIPLLRKRDIQ